MKSQLSASLTLQMTPSSDSITSLTINQYYIVHCDIILGDPSSAVVWTCTVTSSLKHLPTLTAFVSNYRHHTRYNGIMMTWYLPLDFTVLTHDSNRCIKLMEWETVLCDVISKLLWTLRYCNFTGNVFALSIMMRIKHGRHLTSDLSVIVVWSANVRLLVYVVQITFPLMTREAKHRATPQITHALASKYPKDANLHELHVSSAIIRLGFVVTYLKVL